MSSGLFSPPRVNRAVDGWEQRSLRSMLSARSERNRSDLPLLTVARERGVFVRSAEDANHNAIPEDLSNYKVARRGDLVINKMKAWQGSLGLAPVDGIVSPAYFVFSADFAVPEFGEYLLRSKPYVAKFAAASDGVRIGQWDLDIARMREIRVRLPAPGEQAAIVKYLAHANARIDNAIAAKRRLIALLEEQMRVLVERAISDCTASLERLGFHIDLVTGFPFKSEDFRTTGGDGQRPLLRGINVGVGSLSSTDYVFVDEDIAQLAQSFELRAGDLVLGMDRPVIAKGVRLAEITSQQAGCLLVQRVARLRTKSTLEPSYLKTVFRSAAFTQYLEPIFTGISVPHLSPKQIRDFPLPMPTIDEQRAIVAAVGSRTTKLESAVNVAAREVVLLQEFRTRLVADVVTGQVDVRAVAATLPDAPTPVLVADDVPAEADGPWENDDE